jgi:hypothetical protein
MADPSDTQIPVVVFAPGQAFQNCDAQIGVVKIGCNTVQKLKFKYTSLLWFAGDGL